MKHGDPRPEIVGPDSGPEPPFPLKLEGPVIKGFGRGSKEVWNYLYLLCIPRICYIGHIVLLPTKSPASFPFPRGFPERDAVYA